MLPWRTSNNGKYKVRERRSMQKRRVFPLWLKGFKRIEICKKSTFVVLKFPLPTPLTVIVFSATFPKPSNCPVLTSPNDPLARTLTPSGKESILVKSLTSIKDEGPICPCLISSSIRKTVAIDGRRSGSSDQQWTSNAHNLSESSSPRCERSRCGGREGRCL